MPKIEIYTKEPCPYCKMAKDLLASLGASFTEINLTAQPDQIEVMLKRTDGRTTVPEIFIDDRLIGGYDDLAQLHQSGELAQILAP
jgi:GrxC family glutaredoxin